MPGVGGTASPDEFFQGSKPECECFPAEGFSACDPIYGGLWQYDQEGYYCYEDEDLIDLLNDVSNGAS